MSPTRKIQRFTAEIGPIDVLLIAPGLSYWNYSGCTEGDWDFSFNLNVRSCTASSGFLPGMLAREAGRPINMSSVASSVKGVANRFAYGVTKAAVIGLTKSVAADFVAGSTATRSVATLQTPSLDARIRAQAANTGRSEQEVRAAFVGPTDGTFGSSG
jgi:2-keto-3-deoxy-L-fuconate dehydrogenase